MERAAKRPLWSEAVEGRLAAAGAIDVLVGFSTAGPAPALEGLAAAIRAGLDAYWSGQRAAVMHVDRLDREERPALDALGSLAISLRPADLARPLAAGGVLERDAALQAILAAGDRLGPRAIVVLSAELASTTPEWLGRLGQPVAKEDYGFVLPAYRRGRYEGTLTQTLVVPLVRALFGRALAHPIAEEFACSAAAAARLLEDDVWGSALGREGIDLWLPPAAIAHEITVAQAALGLRTLAAPAAEPVGATVGRVAGALFATAERLEGAWIERTGVTPVRTFDEAPGIVEGGPAVGAERMLAGFRQGVRELFPLWQRILAPETLAEVVDVADADADAFRFPDRLWALVVYDFLLAFRFRVAHRRHVAQSLAPLYLGHTASLVLETRGAPASAVAARGEQLGRAFERQKPYLVDRWR